MRRIRASRIPATDDPGQIGIIYVYNDGATADAVTVYYSIGGTAQNGVDYSTLTGVVTIPANQSSAEIDINPIEDGLKPDQTVILTLLQNTNHLIEPAYYSAVNTLYANPEVVPTAYGDTERPCPNTPLSVTLSAFDPNNLPLTYAILSYPVHGILTGTPPYVTYTPTNCYEGQDSFTFKASNGQFDSAPAAVTLLISDPVYASPPSPQTCRGTPVAVTLSGGDACNETLGYAVLSSPLHGFLSGTPPNLTYTPSGTNFTGLDSFNYLVLSECGGDSATGAVTVTVGDANLSPIAQSVMTGTNRPVSITLGASDVCADTNNYTYTIASFPAHGTLSGTGPNRSYTPNPGYEGLDAFQFTVSDGVWVSAPGSVTLFVVAGPVLAVQTTNGCNPFGSWVQLDWSLDTTVERMRQQNGLNLRDFVVYRSATPGGPYTPVYTNSDPNQMSYADSRAVAGQTNYYAVSFESFDAATGATYESPRSNAAGAVRQSPDDLIAPDAVWDVTDVTPGEPVAHLGERRAPLGSPASYATDYPTQPPLPLVNTNWSDCLTWSNHLALDLSGYTSQQLSSVKYSVAVDNDYRLYVNSHLVGSEDHFGAASWSAFQVLSGLVAGTNSIDVVIWGDCDNVCYFSLVATTNTCGW